MKLNQNEFIFGVCSHLVMLIVLITCWGQVTSVEGHWVIIASAIATDIGTTAGLVLFIPFIDEAIDFFTKASRHGEHVFERMHLPTTFLTFLNIYSLGVLETWAEFTE